MKINQKTKAEILEELKKEEQEYENIQYIKSDKNEEDNFKKIVKTNISRRKVINIRPLEADVAKIKGKAFSLWIPYQTLINSVIHQFANNKKISF